VREWSILGRVVRIAGLDGCAGGRSGGVDVGADRGILVFGRSLDWDFQSWRRALVLI